MKKNWWKTPLKYGIGLALLTYVIWSHWEGKPDQSGLAKPAQPSAETGEAKPEQPGAEYGEAKPGQPSALTCEAKPDRSDAERGEAKPGQPGTGLRDVLHRPMRFAPFLIAGLLCTINVSLTFVRWYVLVRAQQLPFTLQSAIRIGLIGYFFNTFLPGSVGGDLVKAAFIAREQQSRRTVAVATVLMDRGIGLWGLIALIAFIGGGFLLFQPEVVRAEPALFRTICSAIAFVIVSVIVWFVLGFLPEHRVERFSGRLKWIPRIGGKLSEFWLAVWLYRNRTGSVLLALLLSWSSHICWVILFYFAVQAFQPADAAMPSLDKHFLIVPMGMIAQGFIPLPGGMGGGEYVFGKLYALLGYPETSGILGSLGWRMIAWSLGLIGYVVYRLMKKELVVAQAPEATATANSTPVPANH